MQWTFQKDVPIHFHESLDGHSMLYIFLWRSYLYFNYTRWIWELDSAWSTKTFFFKEKQFFLVSKNAVAEYPTKIIKSCVQKTFKRVILTQLVVGFDELIAYDYEELINTSTRLAQKKVLVVKWKVAIFPILSLNYPTNSF